MLNPSTLERVVSDQQADLTQLAHTIPREKRGEVIRFEGKSALIIKGIRRCGKSTLLGQALSEKFNEDFHYLNFDDERLAGFAASDFQTLMEVFYRLHGKKSALLMDEIQNVAGWELFINRMLREGMRVYLTGSNADLLSPELGTHLTGRHTDIDVYPFSFREYLAARGQLIPRTGAQTTEKTALLARSFEDYLKTGGMPEAVVSGNTAILPQIVNDIIHKDIIRRYACRKPGELREVISFMLSNVAGLFTFRSAAENFALKSPLTVQRYLHYAQAACLLFVVEKYDRKLKRLNKNPKKIYAMDTGIASASSQALMGQQGALLENAVAIELKRQDRPFYYFVSRQGYECDFVVVEPRGDKRALEAIQVCLDTGKTDTRAREVRGLLSALEELKLAHGLILTMNEEREEKHGNKTIRYTPVWKWMLK